MQPIVSNLIPNSEGHNITTEQIVDVVDNIKFISYVETNSDGFEMSIFVEDEDKN